MLELKNVSDGVTERDDRLRQAMDRLYEVRESLPMFRTYLECAKLLPPLQRAAIRAEIENSGDEFERETEVRDKAKDVNHSAPPVFPPGVTNIQRSPRRPGAPAVQAV